MVFVPGAANGDQGSGLAGTGALFVYGGKKDTYVHGDMWKFEWDSKQWAQVTTKGLRPPRACHRPSLRATRWHCLCPRPWHQMAPLAQAALLPSHPCTCTCTCTCTRAPVHRRAA
jgi:hypothetical protein